jgi:hypothetical protein
MTGISGEEISMDVKIWRTIAIVAAIGCLLLGVGLILALRMEKIKTITIEKTKFINRDIITVRYEKHDPATGNLTEVTETTTDKTKEGSKDSIHDKEVEKPVDKTFLISAGYNLRAGTFTAGAGVVILNFIAVQGTNPVALKFEPAIMASLLF